MLIWSLEFLDNGAGMATGGRSSFNFGFRLTFTFAALIVLILGGNALVVFQFYSARHITERLNGNNQQLIAVLQYQANLLSLHRRLDDLARSVDLSHLVAEAGPLRESLREQTQQTRTAIANLPPGTAVDPTFLPTLDTIDVTLSSEIEALLELAKSGDRGALPPRVSKEFDPIETQTAILVNSINDQASRELGRGVSEMSSIQRRVLIIVPATALSTFVIAAFFGWSIARRFIELRLEERVGERIRIARELHDTLLQSFQGAAFHFQGVRELFLRKADNTLQSIDDAILAAEQGIDEGRAAIRDLRPESVAQRSLPELLDHVGLELASVQEPDRKSPRFRLIVEGEKRSLPLILQDEVYKIAREAIRNAFAHAVASSIEVEIRYDESKLRLRIRDDGKGIDSRILETGGRSGHWGIAGMRERAQRIGGRLEFWYEAGAGTEVQLTIPASIAYQKQHDSHRLRWFRKAGRDEQRS